MRWSELDPDLTPGRCRASAPRTPSSIRSRSCHGCGRSSPACRASTARDFVFTTTGRTRSAAIPGPRRRLTRRSRAERRRADPAVEAARSPAIHGEPAWPGSACNCRWSKRFSTTSAASSAASQGIYQRHDFADEKRQALEVLGAASARRSSRARPRVLPETRLPRPGLTAMGKKWMSFAEACRTPDRSKPWTCSCARGVPSYVPRIFTRMARPTRADQYSPRLVGHATRHLPRGRTGGIHDRHS